MSNEPDRMSARAKLLADSQEAHAKQQAAVLQKDIVKLQKELDATKARDAILERIAVALEKIVAQNSERGNEVKS